MESIQKRVGKGLFRIEQAEQYIRELNYLNDNILDNAPVAIYVVDTQLRVLRWNKYLEKSTGIKKHEILGKYLLEIVPSLRSNGRYDALKNVLKNGVPYYALSQKIERSVGGQKSEVRYQDVSIVPLQDESQIIGATTILSDVTTRKMAEMAAQQAEERMEQSYSRLHHLNRIMSMGELTTSIAHDIGQPLTAIENYVQAVIRRVESGNDDKERLIDLLSKINVQAQRAAEIVEQTKSRIRKYEADVDKHDLNTLVTECVKLSENELARNACELHLQMKHSPAYVMVDKIQIQRVIINLLRNAIESVAQLEDSERHIKLQITESDDGMVSLKVIDSGVGVPSQNNNELFAPFYTTKSDGLGIGLTISESIMKAHQGTICYNARKEEGAEFEIRLHSA